VSFLKNTFKHLVYFKKTVFLLKYFKYLSATDLIKITNVIPTIDDNIIGRYCGSFEDKLVQGLSYLNVSRKFKRLSAIHMEIGVLFGGSCILKGILLKDEKLQNKHCVLAIDPFSGYYDQKYDPTSGLPVNKKTLLSNLNIFNIDPKNILILKMRSQKYSLIIPKLINKNIISLMIDGDHSFDGIKNDFFNYATLIIKGGYLIIDDYGDKNWPEVNNFTNNFILTNPDWKTLIHYDTTLILEKIR
jgi:hypothetical protein